MTAFFSKLKYFKRVWSGTINEIYSKKQLRRVNGEDFAGKIHVHHIKPLAEVDDKYEVDPENDLVPVCPNWHMVLHSKKDVYTIEDVKSFLQELES